MTPNPLLNVDGDFTPDVWRLLFKAVNRYAAGDVGRDELVQEAAVNLLKYGPGYDPGRASLSTFVYRHVAWSRGRLFDARRRRREGRTVPLPADLTAAEPADDGDGDGERCPADLTGALAHLPADVRTLVERRFGLAGGEPVQLKVLAAERGVSTQAVADRVGRTVRRLAVELGAG